MLKVVTCICSNYMLSNQTLLPWPSFQILNLRLKKKKKLCINYNCNLECFLILTQWLNFRAQNVFQCVPFYVLSLFFFFFIVLCACNTTYYLENWNCTFFRGSSAEACGKEPLKWGYICWSKLLLLILG